MRRDGEVIARQAGQTQLRWQVMWTAATGQLTVPDIARRPGRSRQAVQRVADQLVAEQMATFEPNPDHARSPLVVLTRRGSAGILDQINQASGGRNQQTGHYLGDAGIRSLRAPAPQDRASPGRTPPAAALTPSPRARCAPPHKRPPRG